MNFFRSGQATFEASTAAIFPSTPFIFGQQASIESGSGAEPAGKEGKEGDREAAAEGLAA